MAYLSTWVEDVNPITLNYTGNKLKLIKYHSTAKATMSLNGAVMNLDACVIVNGKNKVYDTKASFNKVESENFRFSCEDKDNVQYTASTSLTMIEYVKPTCNIAHSTIDGDGNVTVVCYGNFFNESFGAWENEMIVKCRYKDITGGGDYSTWKNMSVTLYSDGGYTANKTFSDLEYRHVYLFEVEIQDLLETKTATRIISSMPLFHWGKDDVAFEVPVEMRSKLQVYGDLVLRYGELPHGNKLVFGDEGYCYIAEARDDFLTIYANNGINLETGSKGEVCINGSPILYEGASLQSEEPNDGTWTPSLSSSAISSYTARQGWYSKQGNVVTIGFFIKATCNSGYHTTTIEITDLPYTPKYNAAGGGMCSGAYVSSGKTFQCFVAETDGAITTRVQDCNNTTNANLSTSASGCFYRNSGGEITLSGTITYMTA